MKKLSFFIPVLLISFFSSYSQKPAQADKDPFQAMWMNSADIIKQGIDSMLVKIWEDKANDWAIAYKEVFSYNADGTMAQSILYHPQSEGSQLMEAVEKYDFTFNANGNKIQCLIYKWEEVSSQWVAESKEEFSWNAGGNMTQFIEYYWDGDHSQWGNESKEEFSWNAGGYMSQSIEYTWDGNVSQWIQRFKREHTYDTEGNRTQYLKSGRHTGSTWELIYKMDYSYDSDGNDSLSLYQEWDSEISQWEQNWKEEYTLDDSGNIILNNIYEWDEGIVGPVGRSECTYDNTFALTDLMLPEFGDNITPSEALELIGFFDHKLLGYVWSEWDGNEFNVFLKCDYYYSEHTVSVGELGMEIPGLYPNPVSEYFSIDFPGNLNRLTFELYDIRGRKILSREVRNNEAVKLEDIYQGVYIYKIFNNEGYEFSGKLIKE